MSNYCVMVPVINDDVGLKTHSSNSQIMSNYQPCPFTAKLVSDKYKRMTGSV